MNFYLFGFFFTCDKTSVYKGIERLFPFYGAYEGTYNIPTYKCVPSSISIIVL